MVAVSYSAHSAHSESEILSLMPPPMARDVVMLVNKERFRVLTAVKSAVGAPLFKVLDSEVLVDIVRSMEPNVVRQRPSAFLPFLISL